MAATMNKVFLLGNLTRDVELRYTPSGTAVADLGLAVNEKFKNQAGEWQESVSFIDCTCWGRTAEIASEYLAKGSPALIEGRLKQESWDDRDSGQKRSKLKVIVEKLQLIGGKRDGDGGGSPSGSSRGSSRGQSRQNTYSEPAAADGMPLDDDIPF